MKGDKLYEHIAEIDSDIIDEATNYKPKRITAIYVWKKCMLAAACLLLIIGCLSGVSVYAEAKEYKEAIVFFQENDLTTEGLTRGEIKSIYRDITTGKFSYDKTAEVIKKSVGGYEISQADPTPEDLKNLWEYRNGNTQFPPPVNADGASYSIEYIDKFDKNLGFDVLDKTVITKSLGTNVIWNVELTNILVEDYAKLGDSVIVFGSSPTWSSKQTTYGRIALISNDGKLLWDKTTSNGFEDEYIASVVHSDNKIIAFSRGDLKYLCLSEFDMDGNVKAFSKNEIGNFGIRSAAKLGDGYIVQLYNYQSGDLLMKMKADGSLDDSFTYTSEDCEYFITGMIEFNGSVYLSAYSVPKLAEGEGTAGGRYDIAAVLNPIFEQEKLDISNEELTKLVRDNFTAVLLVCNTESGIPQEFYTVKGSLGSQISVSEDGKLHWNVESITDTYFSPFTSSFTVGGASYVYRYVFDTTGKLLSQEKTDEIVPFRR